MTRSKLEEVANRQLANNTRDIVFGALMAVVFAFMLIALTSTRNIQLPASADSATEVVSVGAEIERHTAQVCGDLDAPEPPPTADPSC